MTEPDNEGLPAGFVPAWTFIKTEDGVAEYAHPAGEALDRLLEETVDLGAVFDAEGLCYQCRHADAPHTNGELTCECCMAEHVRRKHGS